METSSEFAELLHQIREGQRELLDFTKKWKEETDRKNQEYDCRVQKWQEDSDRRDQEWKDEGVKGNARWEEANKKANESYTRNIKVVLVLRLIVIAILGTIAAAVWLK